MYATSSTSRILPFLLALLMLATACGEGSFDDTGAVETEELTSSLTSSQRRQRVTLIQQAAAEVGLKNSVLIAGIANSETYLAHCWSELTWACQGPPSASCGGGPVVAGSGDGPCWKEQGGLGYFQFDAGTYDQTINKYGRDVLTVEGNTHHAVEYVLDMVERSKYISGVSTRAQAMAWLETVRVDGRNWDAWIKTVVHYYNGCVPGRCSKYSQRYGKYSADTRAVYREFGQDFWYRDVVVNSDPLTLPEDLSPHMASVNRGDFIPLEWASVDGASTYDLAMEYSAAGQEWKSYHTWEGRSSSSFNVWPQITDMNYRWKVRACRFNTCSDWSEPAYFIYGNPSSVFTPDEPEQPTEPEQPEEPVTPEVPAEPEGMQSPASMSPAGGVESRQSVILTWSTVADAAHYDINVQYSGSGSNWTDYYTWSRRTGNDFTMWPQVDNTNYRWRIRACDSSECSDWSDFEQFYFNGK